MNNGLTPKQIKEAIYGKKPVVIKDNIKKVIVKKPDKVVRSSFNQPSIVMDLPYYFSQYATEYPTPTWFKNKEDVKISIIVPLFKNSIENMIESWDFHLNGYTYEIIFVDDNCPDNSKELALKLLLQKKNEFKKPVGTIISSSVTQGWGASCNIGAQFSKGEVLIFLNPELKLFPGWITSLIKYVHNSDIGMVGSLHVKESDETIKNAGLEWIWSENEFLEIGSKSFEQKKINNAFPINDCPKDIFKLSTKECLDSSCIATVKSRFLDVGGFSPNLFSKKWADADLCMTFLEKGYRLIYQPTSTVYHNEIETKYENKHEDNGKSYFYNKWITSLRINNLVKDKIKVDESVKNILIKRQAAHGDVLIAAAVAPALKKKYPGCKIMFQTDCPEVLKNNPWIDKVIETPSERQFNYLCNLDMIYEYRPNINILTAYAEAINVDVHDCKLFLDTSIIDVPDNYVVFHAGKTLWAGRNWSPIKFDQLSKKIKQDGYNIVCVGTESDKLTFCCDLDLRGKTSISQLAHVIKNSKYFIGIDSFPMHVAQTFNIKSIVFFGSINPKTRIISDFVSGITAKDLQCLGCHHKKLTPCTSTNICEIGVQECINQVSVDMMYEEFCKLQSR